jgi:hypothetical protein
MTAEAKKGKGGGGRSSESDAELEKRIEWTAMVLGSGLPYCEVKRQVMVQFGCVRRTAETYIARARKLLIKWSGQTKEEHFVEGVAFWRTIIQDPRSTLRARMDARRELDALFGLHAPREVAVGGSEERGPIRIEQVIVTTREEASTLIRALSERGSLVN